MEKKKKYRITERQAEVLEAFEIPLPRHKIICKLNISNRTLDSHLRSIFEELGVNSIAEVIVLFIKNKKDFEITTCKSKNVERIQQIKDLYSEGLTSKQIAARVGVCYGTVLWIRKTYLKPS